MTDGKKILQTMYNEIKKILGKDILEAIYQAQGCIILTTEKIYVLSDKPTLDDVISNLKEQIKDGMMFISYPKDIQEVNDKELKINVQNTIIVKDEKKLLEILSEVKENLPDKALIKYLIES